MEEHPAPAAEYLDIAGIGGRKSQDDLVSQGLFTAYPRHKAVHCAPLFEARLREKRKGRFGVLIHAKRPNDDTNLVLLAHMTTGKTIPEIKTLVAQGAVINTDGTITIPVQTDPVTDPVEPPVPVVTEETTPESAPIEEASEEITDDPGETPTDNTPAIVGGSIAGLAAITAVAIIVSKKKSGGKKNNNGGIE